MDATASRVLRHGLPERQQNAKVGPNVISHEQQQTVDEHVTAKQDLSRQKCSALAEGHCAATVWQAKEPQSSPVLQKRQHDRAEHGAGADTGVVFE